MNGSRGKRFVTRITLARAGIRARELTWTGAPAPGKSGAHELARQAEYDLFGDTRHFVHRVATAGFQFLDDLLDEHLRRRSTGGDPDTELAGEPFGAYFVRVINQIGGDSLFFRDLLQAGRIGTRLRADDEDQIAILE